MKSWSLSFRQKIPNKLCHKFLQNEIDLIGSKKEKNKKYFLQKSSLETILSLIKNTMDDRTSIN